jgi:hypothetical protein
VIPPVEMQAEVPRDLDLTPSAASARGFRGQLPSESAGFLAFL